MVVVPFSWASVLYRVELTHAGPNTCYIWRDFEALTWLYYRGWPALTIYTQALLYIGCPGTYTTLESYVPLSYSYNILATPTTAHPFCRTFSDHDGEE